jgi:uncharacterized Fe-S cluster protein YjdI
MIKKYENKKIRVFWDAGKCAHSANCLHGLPQVFDARKRPWIDIDAAEAETIKNCIDTCPSGALRCELLEKSHG